MAASCASSLSPKELRFTWTCSPQVSVMAAIPQCNRPPAELRPWHVVQMIVQAHRMRHDLKTIAEGTIMLDVNMIRLLVSDHQQIPGICRRFASAVDLQLYSEIARPVPVEDGDGLVAVWMD